MGCTTSAIDSNYVLIHPEQEEKRKCIIYEVYVAPRINNLGAPKRKLESVYGNKNPPWEFDYNVRIEDVLKKFGYFVSFCNFLRFYQREEGIVIGNFVFYFVFEVY